MLLQMDVLSRGDTTPSSALISGAYICTLFIFAKIAWVLSIAVRFRGCSLVRWRASNDELRSLPTQRSGSLTPSPSYLAHTLSVAFANVPSPFISTFLSRARGPLARWRTLSSSFSFAPGDAAGGEQQGEDSSGTYTRQRAYDKDGEQRAQAPRTYILTGCYLRGGKSTPRECNFRAEEEEARVPAAPCHKIQGVRDYLAQQIRAHRKDPSCTKLSPRLRTRGTFLTPMRRLSRPSH